jgi:hypothetical protein
LVILKMSLNQKSFQFFLKITHSNLMRRFWKLRNIFDLNLLHFMHYPQLENVNFKKSDLGKMKRLCFGDSKDVFKSKIGQVVPEKNSYTTIHCVLYSAVLWNLSWSRSWWSSNFLLELEPEPKFFWPSSGAGYVNFYKMF